MNDQCGDPLVGIVICTYNNPKALASALRIITQQTYTRHAVVVADDCSECSSDNSLVCSRYPGLIIYHCNAANHGIAATRNVGLRLLMQHFSPDFVTMLDDDDKWPDDRIMVGVRAMGPSGKDIYV
jgi:glycosyltransferase involved in cell wall biosynthesis